MGPLLWTIRLHIACMITLNNCSFVILKMILNIGRFWYIYFCLSLCSQLISSLSVLQSVPPLSAVRPKCCGTEIIVSAIKIVLSIKRGLMQRIGSHSQNSSSPSMMIQPGYYIHLVNFSFSLSFAIVSTSDVVRWLWATVLGSQWVFPINLTVTIWGQVDE